MTSTDSKSELLKLDVLGRVRTSRAKRDEVLDAFEASGMSGASFAKTHGIRYTTFANWVQRRRKLRVEARPGTGFAEVVVRGGGGSSTRLRIVFPGGVCAEVGTAGEAALAAVLLKEIARGGVGC
jgi:hypothetical protein